MMTSSKFGKTPRSKTLKNAVYPQESKNGGNFKMTKTDLIAAVATKIGASKKDSENAVNAVLSAITESLVNGEEVRLVGFGTFAVKERAERKGINPQTKEEIVVPASKLPVFKAGKGLKDAISK